MPFTVPGIGYAGLGQQTAAAQLTFRKAMGSGARAGRSVARTRVTGRPRGAPVGIARRRRSRLVGRVRARRSSSRSKPARMVKGSAAAKRHMAKLRRMRKR